VVFFPSERGEFSLYPTGERDRVRGRKISRQTSHFMFDR